MKKDLTESTIHRQNVLNNRFAIERIEAELSLGGIIYRNDRYFIKQQVAAIFDVDERTIDRCISSHNEELVHNGYRILKGVDLRDFKGIMDVDDIHVVDIKALDKAPQIGIFAFKSVLNLAMLLTESERAKEIRSRILDIVIDVITQKAGGYTKYINQRDEEYLPSAFQEENYRKLFTDAIDQCIAKTSRLIYQRYMNYIYLAIFQENAREYKKILSLSQKDIVHDTFYAEVLDVIAAFEAGFAEALHKESVRLGHKLSRLEADTIFTDLSKQALWKPHTTKACSIMASRDLNFRDALHHKLATYIKAVPEKDYERFLGEKSKALAERIKESLDVYKRLKDR